MLVGDVVEAAEGCTVDADSCRCLRPWFIPVILDSCVAGVMDGITHQVEGLKRSVTPFLYLE